MKQIKIHPSPFNASAKEANRLRDDLKKQGTLFLSVSSTPGAGKTTLLRGLLDRLSPEYSCAVIEADLENNLDACKLAKAGYETLQVYAEEVASLDAGMSRTCLEELGSDRFDIVFLENTGNPVRSIALDAGAHHDLLVFSVPEGMDRPLKYPLMFQKSDLIVLNKIDCADFFDFVPEQFKATVQMLNPGIRIVDVSARNGQGMDQLAEWIGARARMIKNAS